MSQRSHVIWGNQRHTDGLDAAAGEAMLLELLDRLINHALAHFLHLRGIVLVPSVKPRPCYAVSLLATR